MVQRSDVSSLTEAIIHNIDAGRSVEAPFFHLEFDRVFPDDIYAAMIAAMPEASDYRPLPGATAAIFAPTALRPGSRSTCFPNIFATLRQPSASYGIWSAAP